MKRLDQLVFSHWKQLKVWGGTRRGLQLPPMLPRMTLMSRVEKCVSDASTKNLVLHRKKMTTKLLLLNISQDSFYYAQFISYYIPRRTIKVLLRRKVSTKACCFFHTFYDLLIRVVFKTCCPQKWIEITTLRKKKKNHHYLILLHSIHEWCCCSCRHAQKIRISKKAQHLLKNLAPSFPKM